jgi:hypothetical protein
VKVAKLIHDQKQEMQSSWRRGWSVLLLLLVALTTALLISTGTITPPPSSVGYLCEEVVRAYVLRGLEAPPVLSLSLSLFLARFTTRDKRISQCPVTKHALISTTIHSTLTFSSRNSGIVL